MLQLHFVASICYISVRPAGTGGTRALAGEVLHAMAGSSPALSQTKAGLPAAALLRCTAVSLGISRRKSPPRRLPPVTARCIIWTDIVISRKRGTKTLPPLAKRRFPVFPLGSTTEHLLMKRSKAYLTARYC